MILRLTGRNGGHKQHAHPTGWVWFICSQAGYFVCTIKISYSTIGTKKSKNEINKRKLQVKKCRIGR